MHGSPGLFSPRIGARILFMASTLLGGSLASSGVALAQDAVRLDLMRKGQEGQSYPSLIVIPGMNARELAVRVNCGGVTAQRSGPAASGDRIALELKVHRGTTTCGGSIHALFSNDEEGDMPLSFQVTMLPPLGIEVPRDSVDLAARTLAVLLDRPASQVEVEAFGDAGRSLGSGIAPAHGAPPRTPIVAQWSGVGEVLHLRVKAIDADGFWGVLDLFPWSYDIPHEDVVFESGRWDLLPSEEGKLRAARVEAEKVLSRFSMTEVPMNLYVGGYTDTVGDKARNQNLSRERAAAIAGWFRAQGWQRPIYYQGFGEEALAVPTPDETDEIRNRRAVYVLSAEAPLGTQDFPKGDWKRLP